MELSSQQQILEVVGKSKKVLLLTRQHPTEDAVCSLIALGLYLEKSGKEVDMVEIPWAGVLNDMTFVPVKPMTPGLGLVLPARTSRWVLEMWKEEFDSLYEDVGFFTLVVHPTSMGWGSRIPIMEGIIRFIRGYPDVWFATYNEVAEICLQQLKK